MTQTETSPPGLRSYKTFSRATRSDARVRGYIRRLQHDHIGYRPESSPLKRSIEGAGIQRFHAIYAKNSGGSPLRMPDGSTARIAARRSRSKASTRSPRTRLLQNDIEKRFPMIESIVHSTSKDSW